MEKKGTGKLIVGVLLIIIAMVIGLAVGFMFGQSYHGNVNNDQKIESDEISETKPQIDEAVVETKAQNEIQESNTVAGVKLPEDHSMTVITVNDRKVSMDEINTRLHTLRSYYIENYGENPWGLEVDGALVSDIAKAQLEQDILRAELCMINAESLGIILTQEVVDMCANEAQSYMDKIGQEIASEFGITVVALENIYIKYEVVNQVTNQLYDKFYKEISADEANKDLDPAAMDVKVSEAVEAEINSWKDSVSVRYDDVWNNIVVGSMG